MRFGINSFLFTSPFTTDSVKLFPKFKKWGFDTVEIPIEDPSHIDPVKVRAALDKHYGQLKMEGDERRRMQFQDRVDEMKSGPDGKFAIEKESRFVKRKIEELETEMRGMERNMGMFNFKSASGEAMKKDMEKKIEKLARDVERLKGQHRELLKELR